VQFHPEAMGGAVWARLFEYLVGRAVT